MFEIQKIKIPVTEYYFKLFNKFHKQNLTDEFIQKWLNFLKVYSEIPNFIRFDSKIPLLKRLQPNAKSVLIVNFENVDVSVRGASIFPLYLFRAQLVSQTVSCPEGLSFLLLYLEITGIKYVGFYKIYKYKSITEKIKEQNSNIKCYPPSSFKYFCKINKAINGYI